jgi:hypothetical protein
MALNQEADMVSHGGKRAGAGRKPKKPGSAPAPGSKTANFSTRITPEIRAAIEAEARQEGLNVSQMAALLLKVGIDARRDAVRNDPTRALCYLLGELAEIVAPDQLSTDKFVFDWRTDPFLFEALKLSFVRFMDAIRPIGDAISPMERDPRLQGTTAWGSLDSPAARADDAARVLLHNFHMARKQPQRMLENAPADTEKKTLDTPYDLNRAWKGLNGRKTK